MEHPHTTISEVQERLVKACGRAGNLKRFMDLMQDHQLFFPSRGIWDGLSYPTLRKVLRWTEDDAASLSMDTLYRIHLMVQDFEGNKILTPSAL